MSEWEWDETLYAGSAAHYRAGRLPYPAELPQRMADALHLTGAERLLDIGCGPGNLTVLLAPLVAEAVGVDADAGMIAEARRAAPDITWVQARAEHLPADLGRFDVVTFAQSSHWIDPAWIRKHLRELVSDGGAVAHVGANTHAGDPDEGLPHPAPPHARITRLVQTCLGETRRAGRGFLPTGTRDDEEQVFTAAGLARESVVTVAGRAWERSEREVADAVR